MSKENRKKTNGISDYLWAIQAHLDAVKSGRVTIFGNGRASSFKFEKEEIQISADDIKAESGSNNNDLDEHEGE